MSGAVTAGLGAELREAVERGAADWNARRNTARLWARDASLWTGGDEAAWLGWLDLPRAPGITMEALQALSADARGFGDVLLLGMGGSSLGPEVVAATLPPVAGAPRLHVLDSTVPAQVRRVAAGLEPARTLVLVASKSGSTLEPEILRLHFFAWLKAALGDQAGRHCVAVTDPGSKLEAAARADGYRHVIHGIKSVGGRFSALSPFGLVPAALCGHDARLLRAHAEAMAASCGPERAALDNPGVALGLVLGHAANLGRDKLTLVLSAALRALGAWLEQLVAESTGKRGRAIIPVDGEPLAAPGRYGADRLFVHVGLKGESDPATAAVQALEQAGHPVVRIEVAERERLLAEFFRWEMATAVAGAVMGVHPFDQPDVEASKVETRRLTEQYDRSGALPEEAALWSGDGVSLFAPAAHAAALGGAADLAGWLRAHLATLGTGDYVGLLAYLDRSEAHEKALLAMRARLLVASGHATCVGFGPRFLHSTGQAYKGGPASGVFVQITGDDAEDLPVPGQRATFGIVKAAQARGDFEVLAARGRRALRVHLHGDPQAGLERLGAALEKALS
jgi:transaldolase/glucose-6-phosphate isomerase